MPTCGECEEWKIEYALCEYALQPPQLATQGFMDEEIEPERAQAALPLAL